jgi:hypothetical protein
MKNGMKHKQPVKTQKTRAIAQTNPADLGLMTVLVFFLHVGQYGKTTAAWIPPPIVGWAGMTS